MTVRTLILMRHGKSAYPGGVGDHDRPLAGRGRREAARAGEWLRATQPPIDAVRCSTAERTRQTLDATSVEAPVEYDESIYGGYPRELVEVIQLVGDDVQTLLLVGHVPGIPWTAWELAAIEVRRRQRRSTRSSPPPRWRCSSSTNPGPTSGPAPGTSSASTSPGSHP